MVVLLDLVVVVVSRWKARKFSCRSLIEHLQGKTRKWSPNHVTPAKIRNEVTNSFRDDLKSTK
jgi:hypothetical protein